MKKIVILGGGAGGTMVANRLRRSLSKEEWSITVIDRDEWHHYQPGYLFIPFGMYRREDVLKPKREFMPPGVDLIIDEITHVDPHAKEVMTQRGRRLSYDFLVVATGCRIVPEAVDGMTDGWGDNVHTFYTLDGAVRLREAMHNLERGRMVLNIAELPFKCPVAPLEFVFLADWFFTERGVRDNVEIELVTPLSHAFTKPKAAAVLGDFCDRKNVSLVTDFNIGEVDAEQGRIGELGQAGREVAFDLLVAVPPNFGAQVIEDSEMDGGGGGYVQTDKGTLRAIEYDNVYVVGDGSDIPTSKAGSVAHFASEILCENLLREIDGKQPLSKFDGHANCFIESGFEKGILIDFNYDVEPLPGRFPLPGVGPFALLQETRTNHWGKMMFKWIYWNVLLKGGDLPLEPQMSMYGKWAD